MSRRAAALTLGVLLLVGCLALLLLLLTRDADGPSGATAAPTPTGASGPAPSTAPRPMVTPPTEPTEPTGPSEPTPTRTPTATRTPTTPTERPAAATTAAHVFPVAGCDADYAATHHDYPAADIFTGPDCTFVSPVAGRVDEVGRVDAWDPSVNDGSTRGGIFVSVVGADGVRYYGSHLAAVAPGIEPGDAVRAGEALGRIGDTGSARGTGTHLHFGISWPTESGYWWVRRGMLAPQPYLDSWRSGGDASPARAVDSMRREYGDDSTCRAYC